jgi:hypothetical protein
VSGRDSVPPLQFSMTGAATPHRHDAGHVSLAIGQGVARDRSRMQSENPFW